MLTDDGPKVLEYNVRFGDPETQVVLPRLEGDLTALLAEAAAGEMRSIPRFVDDAAVCVVLASEGYPEAPRTGDLIGGLEDGVDGGDAMVLHAGTALAPGAGGSGRSVITSGGRVLNVVALGTTIEEARARAYEKASHISWPGMQRRSDIAGSGSFEASGTLTGPGTETATVSMPEVSDQPETQEVAG